MNVTRVHMKRFTIIFVLILLTVDLSAQINKFGVPLIKNYSIETTHGSEQAWCITKDKFGNIYFGNQERGVTRYDGTKWSNIQIGNNPRIYSLASDDRGIVYIGAAYEFGYLQPDQKGTIQYVSLANRIDSIPEIQQVWSVATFKEKVYYQTPKFIYVYDIQSDSLSKISLAKFNINNAYHIVNISDHLIFSDNSKGMFELLDTLVSPLPGGDFFKRKSCTVILRYDDDQVMVGTFGDGLFLYNFVTGKVNPNIIDPSINDKLKNVKIYSGTKLENDLFAIGTTDKEGILIINKSGELIEQINTDNSDLEENQVLALYCDNKDNSELWISTFGVISKAYLFLKKFSDKQGIESAVNEICRFQSSYYLSTDAGILKSYIDNNNNLSFKELEGIRDQVFPLKVIKTRNSEFILAGSITGIFQINKDGSISNLESLCNNLPVKKLTAASTKKIVQSAIDPNVVYFGPEQRGILIFRYEEGKWKYINRIKNIPGVISGIVEKEEGGLWFLSDDPSGLFSLTFKGNDTTLVKLGSDDGVAEADLNSLALINHELYVSTGTGIIRYDKTTDKFISDNSLTNGFSESKYAQNLYLDDDGDLWYSGLDGKIVEVLFKNDKNGKHEYHGLLNLFPNAPSLDIKEFEKEIFILKSKIIYVVDKSDLIPDTTKVNTSFVRITVGTDSTILNGSFYKSIDKDRRLPTITTNQSSIPEFGYDMNKISFEWTTPYFTEELQTEYSCKLEGFDDDWSKWEGISLGITMEAFYSKKEYNNLPYGHYSFKVRTRTLTGLIGNDLSYSFIILKPWYATIYAWIGFALIAFGIIIAIIKAYTRKLKNENIRLEGIVAERTAVVVKQKEELESSIHYARRIQMALLPSESILSENIKNYFILFKPRDIVSGDFYWMIKKNNRLYIVAADCTGHGVPGAFMSLLGMSFLDEIIGKEMAPRADHVLSELRLHVTESLKQVGGADEAKDGMDMGLLVFDFNVSRIEFSGAYNPCFRVRKMTEDEARNYHDDDMEMADGSMSNGKYLLETLYASKMPIGISSRMNEQFVFYDWSIEKGISYYLFSDGYIDQFGGPHARKFMKKNFKRLILDIQDHPMIKQREILEQNLKDWMDNSPQTDDILVMGIRTE